jgi:hypothetical protein
LKRYLVIGLVALAVLVGGVWVYQSLGCTLEGCDTAVAVTHNQRLESGTYDAEVCVGETCTTRQYEVTDATRPIDVQVSFGDAQFSSVEVVTVTVKDQAGSVVVAGEEEVHFERSQPNGWRCPPVCWFGVMML